LAPNQSGALMEMIVFLAPITVSFGNVSIKELGVGPSNVSGYFVGIAPSHPGGGWVPLDCYNSWDDTAGEEAPGFVPPWSAGGFEWDIPAKWQVLGVVNDFKQPWIESFQLLNEEGVVQVSKFGQTVTRNTNDMILPFIP